MNTANQNPKSFLFTTWDGGGNVAPVLTVARKLIERGHRVRFMCDEVARDETQTQGVEFRPWQEAPNRLDRDPENCVMKDWEATSPQEGVQRMMNALIIAPALKYARDVIAELDREPADLVITSEMLLGVIAGCESRGQAVVALAANLCIYPMDGMPAFGPGFPPPQTPEDENLHEQIKAGTHSMLDTGLETVNYARSELGLPALEHVADQVHSAALYLLETSRAFDFPVQPLPEKIRYVGPQLDEPAWTQSWESPWPSNDMRPLVLVGFSTTYQNHVQVLQNVIDAAAKLPVRILVTLGPIENTALRETENAVFVQSAPHNIVMEEASLVVTHGGHGTVMRALQHELPMVIVPHGRDQGENAIRVTERGAGICLSSDSSCQDFEEALQRIIENADFAKSAAKLGAAIKSGAEDEPVIPLLESLASDMSRSQYAAV